MTELLVWNDARRAIEQARTIDEIKDIRDKAEALRLYAKQAGETLEVQNSVAEIKIRAERRAGELLQEMDKHTGSAGQGRPPLGGNVVLPPKQDQPPTLAEVGISKMQSSRWQKIASIPDSDFEEHIATTKAANKELTSADLRRLADSRAKKEYRQRTGYEPHRGRYSSPHRPTAEQVERLGWRAFFPTVENRQEVPPEVADVLKGLRTFEEQLQSFKRTVRVGKMSPEARRFTAHKVEKICLKLTQWASELKEQGDEQTTQSQQ